MVSLPRWTDIPPRQEQSNDRAGGGGATEAFVVFGLASQALVQSSALRPMLALKLIIKSCYSDINNTLSLVIILARQRVRCGLSSRL